MKVNIRLFVPNTTDTLDFEYGLVIHHLKYSESKMQSEIGLQYYELSEIDPLTNALDVVQRQSITNINRSQSIINGFTLDSHYTLSFDKRFNNKISENSVRQVWLLLHCKNNSEYPFLIEKITDIEEKIISQHNNFFIRLWSHSEWNAHETCSLVTQKFSSKQEILNRLHKDLATEFDQIEQTKRQISLAELKLNTKQAASPTFIVKPINSDDRKIIQKKFLDWLPNCMSHQFKDYLPSDLLDKIHQLQYEITFTKAGSGFNHMIIDMEPSQNTLMVGLTKTDHSIMYCYNRTNPADTSWIQNTWYEVSIKSPNSLGEKTVDKLEVLSHEYSLQTLEQLKVKETQTSVVPLVVEEKLNTSLTDHQSNATEVKDPKPKMTTWWIWPLLIFVSFIVNTQIGTVVVGLAIFWFTIKLLIKFPVLWMLVGLFLIVGVFGLI